MTGRPRVDQVDRRSWLKFLPRAVVEGLLKAGRFTELKGSIRPDVVIHPGNPLEVVDIYDFKFPCVNPQQEPPWPTYARGPYKLQSQGEVDTNFFSLARTVARDVARLGVFR